MRAFYDTLNLQWDRPRHINGVLRKYTISYTNTSGTYVDELTRDLKNSTFYYTLRFLKLETNYKVLVQAHTKDHASPPSPTSESQTWLKGNLFSTLLFQNAFIIYIYLKTSIKRPP